MTREDQSAQLTELNKASSKVENLEKEINKGRENEKINKEIEKQINDAEKIINDVIDAALTRYNEATGEEIVDISLPDKGKSFKEKDRGKGIKINFRKKDVQKRKDIYTKAKELQQRLNLLKKPKEETKDLKKTADNIKNLASNPENIRDNTIKGEIDSFMSGIDEFIENNSEMVIGIIELLKSFGIDLGSYGDEIKEKIDRLYTEKFSLTIDQKAFVKNISDAYKPKNPEENKINITANGKPESRIYSKKDVKSGLKNGLEQLKTANGDGNYIDIDYNYLKSNFAGSFPELNSLTTEEDKNSTKKDKQVKITYNDDNLQIIKNFIDSDIFVGKDKMESKIAGMIQSTNSKAEDKLLKSGKSIAEMYSLLLLKGEYASNCIERNDKIPNKENDTDVIEKNLEDKYGIELDFVKNKNNKAEEKAENIKNPDYFTVKCDNINLATDGTDIDTEIKFEVGPDLERKIMIAVGLKEIQGLKTQLIDTGKMNSNELNTFIESIFIKETFDSRLKGNGREEINKYNIITRSENMNKTLKYAGGTEDINTGNYIEALNTNTNKNAIKEFLTSNIIKPEKVGEIKKIIALGTSTFAVNSDGNIILKDNPATDNDAKGVIELKYGLKDFLADDKIDKIKNLKNTKEFEYSIKDIKDKEINNFTKLPQKINGEAVTYTYIFTKDGGTTKGTELKNDTQKSIKVEVYAKIGDDNDQTPFDVIVPSKESKETAKESYEYTAEKNLAFGESQANTKIKIGSLNEIVTIDKVESGNISVEKGNKDVIYTPNGNLADIKIQATTLTIGDQEINIPETSIKYEKNLTEFNVFIKENSLRFDEKETSLQAGDILIKGDNVDAKNKNIDIIYRLNGNNGYESINLEKVNKIDKIDMEMKKNGNKYHDISSTEATDYNDKVRIIKLKEKKFDDIGAVEQRRNLEKQEGNIILILSNNVLLEYIFNKTNNNYTNTETKIIATPQEMQTLKSENERHEITKDESAS